jgi:hypothetical protein
VAIFIITEDKRFITTNSGAFLILESDRGEVRGRFATLSIIDKFAAPSITDEFKTMSITESFKSVS